MNAARLAGWSALAATLLRPAAALAAPPTGERWMLLELPASPASRDALLAAGADVEGGTRTTIRAELRPSALPALRAALGFEPRILADDLQSLRPPATTPEDGARGAIGYHTPDSVLAELRATAAEHPDVARYFRAGTSLLGQELGGLVLSDEPWVHEPDEPALRLLGTHHGDEWSSMELALEVVEQLVLHWEAGDAGAHALLDANELWVVPVVNPDGVTAFTRRNGRDVDLNRNYAYEWAGGSGAGAAPFSEPETDAMRTMAGLRSFHHSLSAHSGATNLGWVWNFQQEDAPDAAWMEAAAAAYLDATTDPEFWITQGADWYLTRGDTNDWSYGVRGGHDYTLEVTLEKTPPPEQIALYLSMHAAPAEQFLVLGATSGVRGRAVGPDGEPLEARIVPNGTPWPSFTDPESGAFARLLPEGTQEILLSSPGYVELALAVDGAPPGSGAVDLGDLVLPRLADVSVAEASVLEAGTESPEESIVCVTPGALDDLGDFLHGGGDFALFRPGLGGPFPLVSHGIADDPDCASVTLDAAAVPEPWNREGEWTLLLRDAGAAVRATLPLGVLFGATEPGYSVRELEVAAQDGGGNGDTRLELRGEGLPAGAELRLAGPAGQRVAPRRAFPDEPGALAFGVDPASLADGLWSIRIFGNGHWSALSRALLVEDGVLLPAPPPEPPEEPTEEPSEEPGPDPDDDDATEAPSPPAPGRPNSAACSCDSAPGSDHAALALTLALAAASRPRRRRRPRKP